LLLLALPCCRLKEVIPPPRLAIFETAKLLACFVVLITGLVSWLCCGACVGGCSEIGPLACPVYLTIVSGELDSLKGFYSDCIILEGYLPLGLKFGGCDYIGFL
jgi:hypothetical protein